MKFIKTEIFSGLNLALLLSFAGICFFGFYSQYSASGGNIKPFLSHQLKIFFWVGIPAFLISWNSYPNLIFKYSYTLYIFALLLMLAVFFAGKSAMGAKRWIEFAGFNIQPSEFLKVATVLMLAKYFSHSSKLDLKSFSFLSIPIANGILPLFLILKQPSLGAFITICFIFITIYFISGVSLRYFAVLLCLVLAFTPFLWNYALHDYQKARIRTFFQLSEEKDASYNILQSKIAIGSGKLRGNGIISGGQTQLHFLPERQTDFVLSVIAEELGFIGFSTVIILYNTLCFCGFVISYKSKEAFDKITIFGISFLLFLHFIINSCMICGLLPVVGIPLPLISYGGSITIASTICFAFVLKAGMIIKANNNNKFLIYQSKI